MKRTPRKMIVCPSVIETELLGATPLGLGDRPRKLGQDQDANAHRKPLLEAAVKFSALPNDRDQRRAPTGARLMTRHSCARPLHRGVMLLDRPMRDEGASEHALSTRSRAVTAETPA